MKHWKIFVIIGTVALLALGTVGLVFARGPVSGVARAAELQAHRQGVTGVIVSIQDNVITLETGKGEVRVSVDQATVYRMPPKGEVTLADVQQAVQEAAAGGAKMRAIVVAEKNGDALLAKTVAIVPPLPKVTHFVGKVTGIQGNTVTATNAAGETMTVTLPDAKNVKIGQEIVLGIGPGPVMKKGLEGLRLGIKQQAKDFLNRFKKLPAPKQTAIAGVIQSVDTQAKTVTVVARTGKTATLNVAADTKIMVAGASATIDQLKAGDKVVATYNPQSKNALRIMVNSSAPVAPATSQGASA
ncbi:MAG: hypothetical protein Q7T04_06775 [Dehalococcoidia bacterium]|nr:hypothetical protein [Dehalococcoidia bacterium]